VRYFIKVKRNEQRWERKNLVKNSVWEIKRTMNFKNIF
jgi:hypothetical protein